MTILMVPMTIPMKCCSDSEGDSEDTDPDGDNFDSTPITHSVIFKCVGVTKDNHTQEVLAMAVQKLKKQEQVDVRLRKEPNNPKDSHAIAFDFKLITKWERIAYVVKECLDSVHHEMDTNHINSVVCMGQIHHTLESIGSRVVLWNQNYKEANGLKKSCKVEAQCNKHVHRPCFL